MATSLLKSLQCKSTAFDDVAFAPKPKNSSKPFLPSAASCANSSQALRDVVFLFPKHPHPLPKKPPENNPNPNPNPNPPPPTTPNKPKSKRKSKPATNQKKPATIIPSSPAAAVAAAGPISLPTLTELPAGHSSRRVVEIIFGSSWSHHGAPAPFPGRIEMLFRVHNPARTVARFEEYRSAVRLLAGGGDARCAADGNEMMRFHSSGDAGDGIYDAGVVWSAGERGIRTFDGSGGAHESGGWGWPGRRAMLVCRVIAGRVRAGSDPEGSGESVCGAGKGELVVFDPRSVLPCFLIIYKI